MHARTKIILRVSFETIVFTGHVKVLNTYYLCDQTIYKFYASLVLALLGFIYGLFLLSINGFITRD